MSTMFFILLAAAALIAKDLRVAGAEMLVLNKRDQGKEVTVKLGEVVQIELEEAGGTGYLWEFTSLDKDYLVIVSIQTGRPARRQGVGFPLLKKWQLKTQKRGKTQVAMLYHRPWEEASKGAETFTVTLNII